MNKNSSLLSNLRTQTAALHHEVEQATLGNTWQNGNIQLADYQKIILWQYQVHQALEPILTSQVEENLYASRLPALRKDLVLLGMTPNRIATSTAVATPTLIWGRLYVLLGSALGGAVIYKSLQENTHLKALNDFHFYRFQKEQGILNWRTFLKAVKSTSFSETASKEIVAQACETFQLFKTEWENVVAKF